jgi:protease I
MLLANADPDMYDALILPGGVVNADYLRMNQRARDWATQFTDEGKLIAAICHAPWLLVSADLVEGRRITSYYTLQDDIRNAGAEWIDQPVILDGNLITSRQPDDLPAFIEAIEQWFDQTPERSYAGVGGERQQRSL